jgi:isopenicillin-N epimerase
MPSPLARHWALDPTVTFLNHGSYGAVPTAVSEAQATWRRRIEANPVRFMARELPVALDAARDRLAAFVGASPERLVFVPNATAGVSTVLAALTLAPGDVLLTTDHVYGACGLALDRAASRAGARVERVAVPFPIAEAAVVTERLLGALDAAPGRVRLLLLDHVTSPTGLLFPVAEVISAARARGVPVLVDGAHGPGMIPLALDALDADFYTGNLHKWVCAPRGSAFLHVGRQWQGRVEALVTSHGAGLTPEVSGRPRLWLDHDWTGTFDPSAWLTVPTAIDAIAGLVEGGWQAVMKLNAALARAGRDLLCEALDVPLPAPDAMLGSLAALPIPEDVAPGLDADALHDALLDEDRVEVPIIPWAGGRLVRISAHLHTAIGDVARLAEALIARRSRGTRRTDARKA